MIIGDNVSIWANAIIRADDERIEIGSGTVVMENVFIEAPEGFPVAIGDRVLIGHGAIIHGGSVGDDALIGIGAIVLDGAKIGKEAIVAAGALVPPKVEVPERKLVAGIPCKVVRDVSDKNLKAKEKGRLTALRKAKRYRGLLKVES